MQFGGDAGSRLSVAAGIPSLIDACSAPQIVVAPPYETCTSLHNDDAGVMRVSKVVSGLQLHCIPTLAGCPSLANADGRVQPPFACPVCFCSDHLPHSSPTNAISGMLSLVRCVQLDAERLRLQAG